MVLLDKIKKYIYPWCDKIGKANMKRVVGAIIELSTQESIGMVMADLDMCGGILP